MKVSLQRLAAGSLLVYATALCVAGGLPEAGPALLVAAALVVACFFISLFQRSGIAKFSWFWIPYIGFATWAAASLAWSTEPQLERVFTILQVVSIGLICAQFIAKTGKIGVIEAAFYIGVLAAALLSSNPETVGGERQGGSLGHANDLATAIAGATLFASRRAVLILQAAKFSRRDMILTAAVILLCAYLALYSAGSRRAIVIIAMSAIFICIQWALTARTTLRKVIAGVAVVAAAITAVPLIVESTFFFRLESLVSYVSGGAMIREQSLGVRAGMAEAALDIWLTSPFLGIGVDNFRVVSSYGTYSHNNYLEILSGLGVLALFLFYVPIVTTSYRAFKEGLRAHPRIRLELHWAAFLGCVILVSDLFFVSYYDKINWLLLSVLLGYVSWICKRAQSASVDGRS